jgi:hypothetical protein
LRGRLLADPLSFAPNDVCAAAAAGRRARATAKAPIHCLPVIAR